MLRIGEFAWLSQVTVETLRHYDKIGLLKPVQTDRFTGYRYYSLDQLPRLNRILALKDLGLPLEQIGHILDEDLSPDEIRGMLRLKQAELEDQMQGARTRLARVEARIRQIEMEGKMPDYEVVLKTVEPQRVASKREIIPTWDSVSSTIQRLFYEVYNYIMEQGAKQAGPAVSVWHVCKDDRTDTDVEAAIPVEGSLSKSTSVKIQELPKEQMACVVHHGSFDDLLQAYKAGFAWLENNGYKVAGPIREIYLQYEEDGDPANYVTEIQFPVAKS